MAFTALALGLDVVYARELLLTHIIPATRLTPDYMRRMVKDTAYAVTLLRLSHGLYRGPRWLRRIKSRVKRLPYNFTGNPFVIQSMESAVDKGEARALAEWRRMQAEGTASDD